MPHNLRQRIPTSSTERFVKGSVQAGSFTRQALNSRHKPFLYELETLLHVFKRLFCLSMSLVRRPPPYSLFTNKPRWHTWLKETRCSITWRRVFLAAKVWTFNFISSGGQFGT